MILEKFASPVEIATERFVEYAPRADGHISTPVMDLTASSENVQQSVFPY